MKIHLCMAMALVISGTCLAQNEGKNIGKINLSAFAFKGFNIQYERQIADKFTVALGYSNIPNTKVNVQKYAETYGGTGNLQFGNFQLTTSIFTPEVRWYTSKRGAFHGFYVAPYARIGSYNISGPLNFTTGNDKATRTAVFNGKLNAVSGGLMLGSQFKLSKRFYLDWWIVGASFGRATGSLVAVSQLSETEQRDLKSALDDLDVPLTTLRSAVNSNGATVTTNGGIAGVRGLGINVGIRF
jgi:hypothetical protein